MPSMASNLSFFRHGVMVDTGRVCIHCVASKAQSNERLGLGFLFFSICMISSLPLQFFNFICTIYMHIHMHYYTIRGCGESPISYTTVGYT